MTEKLPPFFVSSSKQNVGFISIPCLGIAVKP